MITQEFGASTGPMNLETVKQILQHRDPMLLVDEVIECIVGKSATALKHITGKEDFFQGHFPGYPVMPGVLELEALAQTGAIAVLTMKKFAGKLAFFGGANNVKFRKKIFPGDTLKLEVVIDHISGSGGKGRGTAWVDDQKACEANLTFIVEK